ncbi:MAG TPA: hypothetical protein VGL78_01260 [Solirubrobacteraceae bacterium]
MGLVLRVGARRALVVFAAIAAALAAAALAPAAGAQPLSPGCVGANAGDLDGLYGQAGWLFDRAFAAGERLTVSAQPPIKISAPVSVTLQINGTKVDTTAFPGTVNYTFPAAGGYTAFWFVTDSDGNRTADATWHVSCSGPVGSPGPGGPGFARHLAKLDPGARIGANTIVGTSNGDSLLGVANRVNFIVALGSGERMVGGRGADQLGALGRDATIQGGAGNDLIHGGPGHDLIYGGSGNDLIIDTKGTATIRTGTGRNEVKVTGHKGRDQVLCAPGSVDRIYADRGDYVAPSCRRAAGSEVVYHRPPSTAAGGAQVARKTNGCTNNPHADCAFLAASGSLPGFWWSQKTPERQCPASHPYLQFLDTVPFGSNYPFGVEMKNVGNIGFFAPRLIRSDDYVIGARVGSVTNWTFSSQPWEMWLHCTSDKTKGWKHGS